MISETIKAVRDAEEQAEKIVNDAHAAYREMIEKAEEDAKAFKEQSIAEAEKAAAAEIRTAEENNAAALKEAALEQREEVQKLKNVAFSRKDKIISAVIEKIIS